MNTQNKRFFVEFEDHSYIYIHAASEEEIREILEPTEDTEALKGTPPIVCIEITD